MLNRRQMIQATLAALAGAAVPSPVATALAPLGRWLYVQLSPGRKLLSVSIPGAQIVSRCETPSGTSIYAVFVPHSNDLKKLEDVDITVHVERGE